MANREPRAGTVKAIRPSQTIPRTKILETWDRFKAEGSRSTPTRGESVHSRLSATGWERSALFNPGPTPPAVV
eukprot:2185243-Pyramimonas_sp.AAC.1